MALKLGNLKGIINAVAPTLGTALGGPMGGLAAQAISSVLGVKPEPKAMEKALIEMEIKLTIRRELLYGVQLEQMLNMPFFN